MVRKKRCIFFDRDGTLVETPKNKLRKPKSFNNLNQIHLKTEVIDICKKLKKKYFLMLFTNQPDVKRKKNSKINVENINLFLKKKLSLDYILVNYSDDEKNYFRKPNPGMLFYAKKKFDIDLKNSYVVGDRWRDIDAGYAANCKTIFIDKKYDEKLNHKPDFIVKNIKQILKFIK
jgi:D-glycero-D-manno-heptose 1,7-bisphosphate phosphatase|tara:strand:- start:1022 stop:1546 length:525 start_codon:yes stop_codon:yes gene_type:complete